VRLDADPPGGGTNLIGTGPDGLFLECEQVRGCLSAGDGIAYDPATGEIAARPSTDAGNALSFGTDGGLLVPAGGGEPTALQAGDTDTVDATLTGTGTAADPFVVSADVIVAPAPNGLEATEDGLLVAPSEDDGNSLTLGDDGRLFVPPAPPPEVGCGLEGDGTTATPLAVVPAAGQAPWADSWACDAPTHSTLKCDPDAGLWTPPEHYSAAESLYVEHFVGGWADPITPGAGWAIVDAGANWQFNFVANFVGNDCRPWTYDACASGVWDINYTSDAVFELGYAFSWNGDPAEVRPLWGLLTADGTARRVRGNGTFHEFGYNLDPNTPYTLVAWPAVRVVAGSLTINSWITDSAYHTTTMTP
ncbi:hypothetical protein, partial [Streptomyces olivaceus]|uniref:hypothetical protein n=1 Tax=Streptomyces olivaceus TaxID=47716 RepID=UPI003639605C